MSSDQAAIEGFGRGASAYERGRPGYPKQAVDWICERLQIGPASTVVDLGAGTGKFARLIATTGRFSPIGQRDFRYEQALDRHGLIDRVLSISFIAALDTAERNAVAEQVELKVATANEFRLPYRTQAYLFRRVEV